MENSCRSYRLLRRKLERVASNRGGTRTYAVWEQACVHSDEEVTALADVCARLETLADMTALTQRLAVT